MNLRTLLTIAVAGAISIGVLSRANASDIAWAPVADETGRPSDVLADGALVAAVTAGQGTTVNGVKFVGQTTSKTASQIIFGAAPILVEAVQNPHG
ncbi:MAG TPA: hypothetical protein VK776_18900 [Bryobacteraceae bacterium]|jgi:hypothetical protein|nr:hypothetical protein [Bryobacteraceae bacterium]